MPIRSVTAEDVQTWLATHSSPAGGAPSPYTIRAYYDHARGLLEWAASEGLVQTAAAGDMERPSANGKTYRVLRPSQVDRLLRRDESGEIIEGLRPHDLRHAWISWLVNEHEHEIGIRTVADMAGHEDTDTTEQYRKQNPASRRSAMLRAVGEDEEDGRRPTYEEVADWLQSAPADYLGEGPSSRNRVEIGSEGIR